MNSYDLNEFPIDTKRLEIMKIRIIRAEKNNVKTKENPKEIMVEELRKIIIEEVNKKY